MQEMHQRLHALERKRQAEEAAGAAMPQQESYGSYSTISSTHEEDTDTESDPEHQEVEEGKEDKHQPGDPNSNTSSSGNTSNTNSILNTSPVIQILESMRRQRRAVLAIRKHLLAARRKSPGALASANASNVRLAAQAVLFGAGDSQQGSEGSRSVGRQQQLYTAALLCFDELQVGPLSQVDRCTSLHGHPTMQGEAGSWLIIQFMSDASLCPCDDSLSLLLPGPLYSLFQSS
jgi:hypothetical protein